MTRLLIKWFMPKPKTVANMAADAIAKAINESGKSDIISKYDAYATKAVELQTFVTKLLEDGTIDDAEKSQIADMLEPIVEKILERI